MLERDDCDWDAMGLIPEEEEEEEEEDAHLVWPGLSSRLEGSLHRGVLRRPH